MRKLRFFGVLMLGLGTAPAVAAEITEWDVSLWGKPRAFTFHIEYLAKQLRVRTGGQFKLKLSYGGLSPPRENLERLAAGKFQMAQFCAGYHPEKNRAITVLELPFLGVETLEQELAASRAVYAHPAVVEEMAKWNAVLLMPTPLPQYNLVGRGATPADTGWFNGKRIRATGGIAQILAKFGAETVSLTAPETREAFASGEIDAVAFAPHAHFAFDTISYAEWWTTNLNPGTVHCPVVMNADAFAALPEAHRTALLAAVEPAMSAYLDNYRDLTDKWASVLDLFEKTTVTIDASVIGALRANAPADIAKSWVEDSGAAGLPAEELLSVVRKTLK